MDGELGLALIRVGFGNRDLAESGFGNTVLKDSALKTTPRLILKRLTDHLFVD
jgi:hypothetical protein